MVLNYMNTFNLTNFRIIIHYIPTTNLLRKVQNFLKVVKARSDGRQCFRVLESDKLLVFITEKAVERSFKSKSLAHI